MSDKTIQDILYLLGAWERGAYAEEYSTEIDSLRQALAQPEQPDLLKAAEMALDALKYNQSNWYGKREAIAAIEAELLKPEQDQLAKPKQPEALRLLIDDLMLNHEYCPKETILEAAKQLRRLHEVNQSLLEALQNLCKAADNGHVASYSNLWDDAKAAIAKARGEQA